MEEGRKKELHPREIEERLTGEGKSRRPAAREMMVAAVMGKMGMELGFRGPAGALKARRRWRGAAPRHAVGRWHLPLLAPSTRVVAKS